MAKQSKTQHENSHKKQCFSRSTNNRSNYRIKPLNALLNHNPFTGQNTEHETVA